MPIRMPIIITASFMALIVISCSAHTVNKEIKPVKKSEKTIMIKEPPVWKQVNEVEEYCQEHLDQAQKFRKILIESKNLPQGEIIDTFNNMFIELDRVLPLSSLNANVHPKADIRAAAEVCQQKAMQVMTDIELDRNLFEALSRVDQNSLTGQTGRFVKLLMRDYKRAGVARAEETRKKISEIRAELVTVEQEFSRNIREDVRSLSFPATDVAGLPDDFLKAHQPNEKGEITITTKYPDFFPFQTYVKKAEPRKKLYQAFLSRAYPDNEKLLMKMLELRHRLATVLGYPNWAAYNADDKMVKDTKTIKEFIDQVAAIGKVRMEKDLTVILERKKQDQVDAAQVHVWDRFYYVKKIQQEQYDVDPLEVRQYFNVPQVKKGLLDITQKLFNVTFVKNKTVSVWHESVEAYDVLENDQVIARFYLDLHPREGKFGHAAEFPIYSGIDKRQLPMASLVSNFPDPKEGDGKALMEHNQVVTFFHEFGHLMHQLVSGRHQYITMSGISCEWDFVEAPSQLLEEWAWDPTVLSLFATHHKTGAPIPKKLVQKMKMADEFGKGIHVMRQMFYAALSFNFHIRKPTFIDPITLLKEMQQKYNPYPYQEGTRTYASFGHLEGYSSMYYTYMWSLVIAKDLFTSFKQHGLMNDELFTKYKQSILEPGGTVEAATMVENFLGRPYNFEAYRQWLTQE